MFNLFSKVFFVFATKSRFTKPFYQDIVFSIFFNLKICFLEPEPVGAELSWVAPGADIFTWCLSQKKKNLEPEPTVNGSAPQHWPTAIGIFSGIGKSVKIRRFKEHLHHGSRIWMIIMKTMKQGSLWLNSYFCVLPIQKNWNFFCFMVLFLRGKLEFAWGKNLPLV